MSGGSLQLLRIRFPCLSLSEAAFASDRLKKVRVGAGYSSGMPYNCLHMASANHFDVIVIGTGAGGGALAQRLAPSGQRILILERGTFLPQEKENWNTEAVFMENRYHTDEVWQDSEGRPLHPQTAYWVGGNTKVYGAALFRLRERDFETVQHEDGVSPEWPLKYRDYQSYYDQAEVLYQAHGTRGADPTEPPSDQPYPCPAVSNEPRIQEIHDELKAGGYNPFPCPVGIKLNESVRWQSQCIRCDTCDGFPAWSRPSRTRIITASAPSLNCRTSRS